MSTSFSKLFSSITDSSIWSEDAETKVVWVTMMAMCDQFGRVEAALPGLAKRANVSIEKTEAALQKFLSPDIYSRTKDHDGRRIEVIDRGWRLLNYEFYRELRSAEDRKQQNREAQQRRRAKGSKQAVSSSVSTNQQNQPPSAQAEAEAEAEAEADRERAIASTRFKVPTVEMVKFEACRVGMTEDDGEDFWHHYSAQGWKMGNNVPMTEWRSALKRWKSKVGSQPKKEGLNWKPQAMSLSEKMKLQK